MTFGEKYTEKDIKNFFDLVNIEDGKLDAKYITDLLLGRLKDE